MAIIESVPYTEKKVQRRLHRFLVTCSEQPLLNQRGHGIRLIERRANPQGCMIISQPSRALFDVGFHEVDSVGEVGMPLPVLGNFLSDESMSPPQSEVAMADFFRNHSKSAWSPSIKRTSSIAVWAVIRVRHLHDITPGPHTVAEGVTNIPEEVKNAP